MVHRSQLLFQVIRFFYFQSAVVGRNKRIQFSWLILFLFVSFIFHLFSSALFFILLASIFFLLFVVFVFSKRLLPPSFSLSAFLYLYNFYAVNFLFCFCGSYRFYRYAFVVRAQHFNRNGKIVDLTLFYSSWWWTCAPCTHTQPNVYGTE